MIQQMLEYLTKNHDKFLTLIKEHITISLISIGCALFIGFVLSMIGYRFKKLGQIISSLLSVFRIIPSLAILILCIPYIGVGMKPATIALTLLAVPPIYINTVLAFEQVPSHYIEVGKGMGLTKRRIFFQIEIPLALPTILLGLRIAAIEVIASATIASYIGAGGIGSIILTGMNLFRMDLLLLGGITVAILAISVDVCLHFVERLVTSYQRK